MERGTARELAQYGPEWLTMLLTAALALGVGEFKITERFIPTQSSGCTDPSLLYPHTPDIVPNKWLWIVSLGGPVAVGIGSVLLRKACWWEAHHLALSATQAVSLAGLFKRAVNVLVGRHRPDWYDRVASGVAGDIANGKMSYPSGHSACSTASMVVVSLYLLGKLRVFQRSRWQMLHMLAAVLPVGLSTFISVSRLMDYHHNFSDVNAGVFIGFASALVCYHLHHFPAWGEGPRAGGLRFCGRALPTSTAVDGAHDLACVDSDPGYTHVGTAETGALG